MLKRSLLLIVLVSIIGLPVQAQKYPKKNSCVPYCDNNCKDTVNDVACFAGCMGMCVPEKTGNKKIDEQNLCDMKCAGKRDSFQDCIKDCMGE